MDHSAAQQGAWITQGVRLYSAGDVHHGGIKAMRETMTSEMNESDQCGIAAFLRQESPAG